MHARGGAVAAELVDAVKTIDNELERVGVEVTF